MAHGGKKRRFRLVGFFGLSARLSVFIYQRTKLCGASFNLSCQMLTMAIERMNAGTKGIHQTTNGIQFTNARGFREGGINIAFQKAL